MADGKRGRRSTLDDKAEKIYPSLSPEEGYVLDTIRRRRKDRSHARCDISQIIADALWLLLTEVEGITKEELHETMTRKPLREL
jgi:hypothetical protein